MLTDEIMKQIEMKTGVPKKQQRITHQSKQLTTSQTLKDYNIHENDTIDLSLELHDGQGRQAPQSSQQWTQKKLQRTPTLRPPERKPPKRAPEAGVDVPKAADVDATVQQIKNDMERLAK